MLIDDRELQEILGKVRKLLKLSSTCHLVDLSEPNLMSIAYAINRNYSSLNKDEVIYKTIDLREHELIHGNQQVFMQLIALCTNSFCFYKEEEQRIYCACYPWQTQLVDYLMSYLQLNYTQLFIMEVNHILDSEDDIIKCDKMSFSPCCVSYEPLLSRDKIFRKVGEQEGKRADELAAINIAISYAEQYDLLCRGGDNYNAKALEERSKQDHEFSLSSNCARCEALLTNEYIRDEIFTKYLN